MEFYLLTTGAAFVALIVLGVARLVFSPTPTTTSTIPTMVLPSMVVFGLLCLGLGVKLGGGVSGSGRGLIGRVGPTAGSGWAAGTAKGLLGDGAAMAYCPQCGDELDPAASFCSQCGAEAPDESGQSPPGARSPATNAAIGDEPSEHGDGWWYGVALPLFAVAVPMGMAFVLGFVAGTSGGSLSPADERALGNLMALGWLLSVVVAPYSFHRDRAYVRANSDWDPSDLYYVLFVPALNTFVAGAYLLQRRTALRAG